MALVSNGDDQPLQRARRRTGESFERLRGKAETKQENRTRGLAALLAALQNGSGVFRRATAFDRRSPGTETNRQIISHQNFGHLNWMLLFLKGLSTIFFFEESCSKCKSKQKQTEHTLYNSPTALVYSCTVCYPVCVVHTHTITQALRLKEMESSKNWMRIPVRHLHEVHASVWHTVPATAAFDALVLCRKPAV